MRTAFLLLVIVGGLFHTGCTPGPSPEARSREAAEERDAERRQAEFRKGLPPVDETGR